MRPVTVDRGTLVVVELDPTVGREQRGVRSGIAPDRGDRNAASIVQDFAGYKSVHCCPSTPQGPPRSWRIPSRRRPSSRSRHELFASTDDWDGQLSGAEEGWPGIARVLRLYVTHFRGQRSATMRLMAPVAGSSADA